MFKIIPYRKEHVIQLLDQPINMEVRDLFLSGVASSLENTEAFTGVYEDSIMICGGVIKYWDKRAHLWCVFSENCKDNFIPVFRGIRSFLTQYSKKYPRIEMAIPSHFEDGKRRARLLGFKCECEYAPMFLPNGEACSLYALVRET